MSSQSNDLFQLRDTIEKMTKFNQIAILRILNDSDDVIINENRNGIHINLSELSEDVIRKLQEYTNYVNTQETTLNQDEKQKEDQTEELIDVVKAAFSKTGKRTKNKK